MVRTWGVVSVDDTGHISIGVECECVTNGPRGHYVAIEPIELERFFRWLCDRVEDLGLVKLSGQL